MMKYTLAHLQLFRKCVELSLTSLFYSPTLYYEMCLLLHWGQCHKDILLPSRLRHKGDSFMAVVDISLNWSFWQALLEVLLHGSGWSWWLLHIKQMENPPHIAEHKVFYGRNVSKCFYSFEMSISAFLTWAWSAESVARSPPLWASGWGSSAAAAGCLWTRSGCVSSGRFDWHSLEPLSARRHPWPGGHATPSWSGGHVGLKWRPL